MDEQLSQSQRDLPELNDPRVTSRRKFKDKIKVKDPIEALSQLTDSICYEQSDSRQTYLPKSPKGHDTQAVNESTQHFINQVNSRRN